MVAEHGSIALLLSNISREGRIIFRGNERSQVLEAMMSKLKPVEGGKFYNMQDAIVYACKGAEVIPFLDRKKVSYLFVAGSDDQVVDNHYVVSQQSQQKSSTY